MKTLLWKFRFSRHAIKLLGITPWQAWDIAGSWLEMLNGDTDECPKGCAEEERDAWLASM